MDLWVESRMTTLRLAAYETGDKPSKATLVVLHGLGVGIDVVRDAVPRIDPFAALAGLGVNVLAVDWPGHGASGGRRGHLTYRLAMDATASAVEVACDRWQAPVVLLGTGLGGTLACYAALEDDRVRAVVTQGLLDLRDIRPVMMRTRQQVALPAAALLRRRLDGRWRVPLPLDVVIAPGDLAFDPRLARRLRRHPRAVRTYDVRGLGSILLAPEDKPALGAMTTPTLVVVGGADVVLSATASHAAAAQLSGTHEFWVLPAAGHQLLLEHAGALLPRIRDFLDTALV